MSVIEFLRALYPKGPWVLAAIHSDGGTPQVKTFSPEALEAAETWIARKNRDHNLYFMVNKPIKPLSKKASREDVQEVGYLHVDVDARVGEPLDEELNRIQALLCDSCPVQPPTFSVFTGGGYQAFWKLAEPVPINGDLSTAKEVELYNIQLAEVLGGDSCHSIEHLMRLPGTTNLPTSTKRKRGRKPAQAVVEVYRPERVYSLRQFQKANVPEAGESYRCSEPPEDWQLSRLESIDELDQYGVPGRIKTVILNGSDPDNPKQNDNSRSAWLFDACCQLVRFNVPDEVVYSIITDPDFSISDSVLDKQPNALDYAMRQIERAHENVSSAPLLLKPDAPMESAHEFLSRERPNLLHYNEDWLAFEGVAYSALEDGSVQSEVYKFLHKACCPTKQGNPAPFNPNRRKVADVIESLKAQTHRQRDRYSPPCWLSDGQSEMHPLEIVACQNGLLHLPTGKLHEPTPDFFTRNALSFDFNQDAPKPEAWFKFLKSIWGEGGEEVATLQEIFGYLLIPDTTQQKIFLLVGPPRSGKGTIGHVLEDLVGHRNTCAPTPKSLEGDFGLQPLIGKQLAIISDLRLGRKTDHAAVAGKLLSISGADSITANRKYKDAWHGRLSVRFFIMTNELPRLVDASGALANRFVPLMMTKSFLGKENPHLLDDLLQELPGILNWAIVGWRRLHQRQHFILPESSREAVHDLHRLASPVAAFVEECCVLDPSAVIPKGELFDAWVAWRQKTGMMYPSTLADFSKQLLSATWGKVETRKSSKEGRRIPSYIGVRLCTDQEEELPF